MVDCVTTVAVGGASPHAASDKHTSVLSKIRVSLFMIRTMVAYSLLSRSRRVRVDEAAHIAELCAAGLKKPACAFRSVDVETSL